MPDFVLDHEPAGFARIKVVGVGGGGCNAIDSMFDIGLQNVEFFVVNSDLQALKRSKCPNRIQIGSELTQGRGCGADPRLGETCMEEAAEEMRETLQGADIVFVTAGMGGGTGTGAAHVVARIARDMGILTVGVVTKPFKFEGPRRKKSGEYGVAKLRDACDTIIAINNDRLLDVVGPKVPMKEAFAVADKVLAQAVTSISDLVATPGLINVDFNDVRTIMGGKGGAVMGVGVGKGENRAAEAVKKATNSPLLDKIVIDGATGVLICITGGQDMTLQEVNEATTLVQEAGDPDAEVIFGAVVDDSLTDTIRVTIIATGFRDELTQAQLIGEYSEPQQMQQPVPQQPTYSRQMPQQPAAPQPPRQQQAPAAPMLNNTNGRQPQQAQELADVGLFDAMEDSQPQPAPQAPPQPARRPDSLRSTLEKMMADQNQPTAAPAPAPRAAAPQPQQQQPQARATNGGGHPNVRPASSEAQARPAAGEAKPSVSLFDPAQEEQKSGDYETPAFLRRRRSLFE